MKQISLITCAILLICTTNVASALDVSGVTVSMTGMENDGTQVYVGMSSNPVNCLYGGMYFLEQAELSGALGVAMAAKVSGKTVRMNYSQPGGPGTICYGKNIYRVVNSGCKYE